jgi:hypothetical protein
VPGALQDLAVVQRVKSDSEGNEQAPVVAQAFADFEDVAVPELAEHAPVPADLLASAKSSVPAASRTRQ